jgi:hypothetical protein
LIELTDGVPVAALLIILAIERIYPGVPVAAAVTVRASARSLLTLAVPVAVLLIVRGMDRNNAAVPAPAAVTALSTVLRVATVGIPVLTAAICRPTNRTRAKVLLAVTLRARGMLRRALGAPVALNDRILPTDRTNATEPSPVAVRTARMTFADTRDAVPIAVRLMIRAIDRT